MSLRLENLFKPFSVMSEEEQLLLIRKVRHNRFTVRPSKVKIAAKKQERKVQAKKQDKAKELLRGLSQEERAALLKRIAGE